MVVETERRRALLFELVALISFSLLPAVVRGVEHVGDSYMWWRRDYASLFQTLGEIFLLLFIVWNSGDEYQTFGIKKPNLKEIAVGVGIFLAMITSFRLPELRGSHSFKDVILYDVGVAGLVRLAIGLSLSSVLEEILYRGIFIPRMSELLRNEWAGVALSSTLFAAGHLYQGWIGVFQAMALGLLAGIGFKYTKSLTPGIIGHVLSNLSLLFL